MARDTRILVIDDDPNINRLIALYLQKENFSVISAYRGDDGLEMVKKEAPDLVLLDIMLPGMDGWQVCRAVRQISSIPDHHADRQGRNLRQGAGAGAGGGRLYR